MPSVPPRRVSRRHVVGLAAGILIVALAAVPAVTAQGGDGDHQDTVGICHFDSEKSEYEIAQAWETDFYGVDQQGHGTHGRDIVPPFTIENPRPGDPSSFEGRNLDDRGQSILNAGCVEQPEPGSEPERKVRICHATNSVTNPYTSPEPAIANNGDLNGGHLDHKGPVYPADNWGDIIPPYTYVDQSGQTKTFPGYNWSPAGQAIYQNSCEPPTPPKPKEITPILECVEPTANGFLAHWGYTNPNGTTVEPIGDRNSFSPGDADRGQPKSFAAGRVEDAFQTEFDGSALTWNLTGKKETAISGSPRCQGSITVTKQLLPGDDTGLFNLKVDDLVAGGAEAVGDGGSTGTIAVDAGQHTVSETGASGTQLSDYATGTVCSRGNTVVASANASSVDVRVGRNEAIVCVITNTAKPRPGEIRPVLECVLFNDGSPDAAYWGYTNTGDTAARIPVESDGNRFSPAPENRGQPGVFERGRHTGVFRTSFQAGGTPLVWHLSGRTASASDQSTACNPTVELRKVTIPANDPGVFQLRINGAIVATGGNGTTSGPLRTGIGEGTASETAAPGTNLADYDSKVECTRDGAVAISVPGTTADGEVRSGDTVVCTFTNTRKGTPPEPPQPPTPPTPPNPPTPPIPPVPPPPPGPPPVLDLAVTKSVAPTTVGVGGRLTWTMTVTNRSSVAAADVNGLKLDDPRSYRTRLISLTATQGTCRPFTCNLGRLAAGGSATITAVTEATQVGLVVDIVRVGSEEPESNYRNNVAAALARVVGPLTPPAPAVACRILTAEPQVLQRGRSSVVRLTARNRLGRPLANAVVRARGAGVRQERLRTDAQGVARFAVSPERGGLVYFWSYGRKPAGKVPVCRTLLGVLGASSTQVTG